MKLEKGKNEKKDYGRVGEGTFGGRVVQIIDFGRQYKTNWKTQEIETNEDGSEKTYHPIYVTFELPTETITIGDEEKPRWVSKEYNFSSSDLAKIWELATAVGTPDDFDPVDVIGKPVMIQIGSTGTGKDKVSAVSQPPKGFPIAELYNDPKIFDLTDPDMEIFGDLPDWMTDKIKDNLDFEGSLLAKAMDVPF